MDITLIQLTAYKFDSEKFYDLLFSKRPELRKRFPDDMTNHHKVFTVTISELINKLEEFESLKPEIRRLGRRHGSLYEVKPEDYELVGSVLLESLELDSPEQTAAWTELYQTIVDVMLEAYPPKAAE